MIDWYIDSSRNEINYLNVVMREIKDIMDHLCKSLVESNCDESLEKEFSNLINKMPILNLNFNGDDLYIRYNKHTTIKFNDPFKLIKRDIILNKILLK